MRKLPNFSKKVTEFLFLIPKTAEQSLLFRRQENIATQINLSKKQGAVMFILIFIRNFTRSLT